MRKLLAVCVLCGAAGFAYAQNEAVPGDKTGMPVMTETQNKAVNQQIQTQQSTRAGDPQGAAVRNEGLNAQLRVMERRLAKSGVDKEGIETAKQNCVQLHNEGFTPEECTRTMTQAMQQLRGEGLQGKELGEKARERARERLQIKLQEKEELKLKTQQRTQDRDQLRNEIGETIRQSRPEDKGGTGASGNGENNKQNGKK